MSVVHLADYRPLPADATEDQQLDAWALEILRRDPANWIIPDTSSMRRSLERLWSEGRIEKGWIGKHAYRIRQGG